jgi:predicted dehydrogenase
VRVGLIGRGRWGVHIQRALGDLGYETSWCDPAQPGGAPSADALLERVDRVVIATPPQSHAALVRKAISARVPFMVEKPLAMSAAEAFELVNFARAAVVQGAVGHIALSADGVQPYRGTRPLLTQAIRTSANAGYHGIPAWWDIGVHDVAVCVDLYGRPETVSVASDEDVYAATLAWPGATAILRGSRIARQKRWRIWFDDEVWDAYADPGREPLKNQIDWWVAGGDNLDAGALVVETLERGS